MPKVYSIKWIIDDAQARGVWQRGVKGMESVEAAALKAATAMERAHGQAVATAVNGYAKVGGAATAAATAQVNGVNRVATAAATTAKKKVVDLEAIELKWSVRDYKIRVKAEADKERLDDFARARFEKSVRDRESLELNWLNREYKERVAYEKKKEAAELGPLGRMANVKRRALTEEEMGRAAAQRHMDAMHRRRVAQIEKLRFEDEESFVEAIKQATGLEAAFTKVGLAMAGFQIGKELIGAVAGAMGEAQRAGQSMAKEVLDTLSALRDIAALKDKYAPGESELEQHIAIRKASGLTQAEAVETSDILGNVMGTIDPKKLPQAERDKLEVKVAQMVARRGGQKVAKPLSQMAGVVADMVPAGKGGTTSAASIMAMLDAVDEINKKGATTPEVSTAQSLELMTALTAPDLKGSFNDPRKAVALNTIASKFAMEHSGTASLQAIRQVRGFTKWRQGKGMSASQAKTLQDAGIAEQDDPAQAMRKLFVFAQKNMGKDEAFDAFLKRRGFRSEEGDEQLMRFYNEYRKGNFDRIMDSANAPLTQEYEAKTQAYLASDLGRSKLADAEADAAKLHRGKRRVEQIIGTRKAEAELTEEGAIDSPGGSLLRKFYGTVGFLGGKSGEQIQLEMRALKDARRDAGNPRSQRSFFGDFGEAAFTDTAATLRELRRIAVATEQANARAATPAPIPVVRPAAGPAH